MNDISFLPSVSVEKPMENSKINTITPHEGHKSFASILKKSIEELNEYQIQSDKLTEKLAQGKDVDLHQVMIASQKASITMQTALEVRNKVIEAYQETMRMQV